jgi:hypothetical protein
MKPDDRKAFLPLFNTLASAFRVELSPSLIQAYWQALSDLPLESVEAAIDSAMRSCRFMPVPADLRSMAGEMPADAKAALAWDAVRRAIRAHGAYASVDFDHPAVNAAVRSIGGWLRLCSLDAEELDKWTRKDFEKVFLAFADRGPGEEAGRPLVGLHEASDQGKAQHVRVITGIPAGSGDRRSMLKLVP